jgi:hypothetical protein
LTERATVLGVKRQARLTPEQRSEQARNAVLKRWTGLAPEERAAQSYWAKLTPKRWMFEHGRMPAEELRRSWLWNTVARRDGWPQWVRAAAREQGAVPAVRAPEDVTIVVAGGDLEIPQHAYFPSWGFPPCRIVKEITT